MFGNDSEFFFWVIFFLVMLGFVAFMCRNKKNVGNKSLEDRPELIAPGSDKKNAHGEDCD